MPLWTNPPPFSPLCTTGTVAMHVVRNARWKLGRIATRERNQAILL